MLEVWESGQRTIRHCRMLSGLNILLMEASAMTAVGGAWRCIRCNKRKLTLPSISSTPPLQLHAPFAPAQHLSAWYDLLPSSSCAYSDKRLELVEFGNSEVASSPDTSSNASQLDRLQRYVEDGQNGDTGHGQEMARDPWQATNAPASTGYSDDSDTSDGDPGALDPYLLLYEYATGSLKEAESPEV